MKRIGYDDDTQCYYYKDKEGSIWRGVPGARYSEMTRGSFTMRLSARTSANGTCVQFQVPTAQGPRSGTLKKRGCAQALLGETDTSYFRLMGYVNILTSPHGARLRAYQPAMAHKSDINAGAYRTLFPFFLLISAVLLLVWRLVLSPTLSTASVKLCPKAQTIPHLVQPGDTCWEIAKAQGCSLEELKELNAKAHCDKLMPGEVVCVPGEKTKVNPAMLKRSARN